MPFGIGKPKQQQSNYIHIPTAQVWKNPQKSGQAPQGPIKSVVLVMPPYCVDGGTEWVGYQLARILMEKGIRVTLVVPGDFDYGNVCHMALLPYTESAVNKTLYVAPDGQEVKVRYNAWEYYVRYYQTAEDMIRQYTKKADAIILMYSNTFDRIFLNPLLKLGKDLRTRVCCVWNTVFPQDPLAAAWWTEELEFFADQIAQHYWLGYSDEMAGYRPAFMGNYVGSVDQPIPPELLDNPVLPLNQRDIEVFCATTITEGKCLHLLLGACGQRNINLVLAARSPQGRAQQQYWGQYCEPLLKQYRNLHFIGERTQAECLELMQRAVLTCNPSLYREPYGLVNRQSGAMGAGTVAFACGGFVDSIDDGLTGALAQLPSDLTYHDVYRDRALERQLVHSLGDTLEWALTPGNLPEPQAIQDHTRARCSFDVVGGRWLELLAAVPSR